MFHSVLPSVQRDIEEHKAALLRFGGAMPSGIKQPIKSQGHIYKSRFSNTKLIYDGTSLVDIADKLSA